MNPEIEFPALLSAAPTLLIAIMVQVAVTKPMRSTSRIGHTMDRLVVAVGVAGAYFATFAALAGLLLLGDASAWAISTARYVAFVGTGLAVLAVLSLATPALTRSEFMAPWTEIYGQREREEKFMKEIRDDLKRMREERDEI